MGKGRSIKAGLKKLSIEASLTEIRLLHEHLIEAYEEYKTTGDSLKYLVSIFSSQGLLKKLEYYKKFSNKEVTHAFKILKIAYDKSNLQKATEELIEANKDIGEDGIEFLKEFKAFADESFKIISKRENSIEKIETVSKNFKKADENYDKILEFMHTNIIEAIEEVLGSSVANFILDLVKISGSTLGEIIGDLSKFIPGVNIMFFIKDLILGKYTFLKKISRIADSIANQQLKKQTSMIQAQLKNFKNLSVELYNKQTKIIKPLIENFVKENERIWEVLREIKSKSEKIYLSLKDESEKIKEIHIEQQTRIALYDLQNSAFNNILFLCAEADNKK